MGLDVGCVICEAYTTSRVGVLCARCAASLDGGDRAPGIVCSKLSPDAAVAWLVDAWGQLHPISARCAIGRDRSTNELVVADLAISAEHAELRRESENWRLYDRGSANGSGIEPGRRTRSAVVKHRQSVWFGVLSFFLWDRTDPPAWSVTPPAVRTLIPKPSAFRLQGARGDVLEVHAVAGYTIEHAPGELVYQARRTTLPRLQFQLMRVLCETADEYGNVVGLRSHELLERLPFQTTHPEATHVRQVVSTLRAALERVGVPGGRDPGPDGIIHASERLGYRITWSVQRTNR